MMASRNFPTLPYDHVTLFNLFFLTPPSLELKIMKHMKQRKKPFRVLKYYQMAMICLCDGGVKSSNKLVALWWTEVGR